MDIHAIAAVLSAFGLSASAGLNAYIPLLIIALAARFTPLVNLSAPYDLLTSTWVIAALAALLLVEILADKIPLVDSANDVLGLAIRPAAGALLFAASTGTVDFVDPRLALIAGLVVAGAAHGAKATARPMITASTGGVGNPIVSTVEDVTAFATSVVAIVFPLLIGGAIVFFVALWAWWSSRRRGRGSGSGSGHAGRTPDRGARPAIEGS